MLYQKEEASHPKLFKRIIKDLQKYKARRTPHDDIYKEIKSEIRPPNLKYAVGMVMYHLRKHNQCSLPTKHCRSRCSSLLIMRPCVGVICDWSIELSSDRRSLFKYKLLLHDGSYTIVEEGLHTNFNSYYDLI